jgi:hypothetical protein
MRLLRGSRGEISALGIVCIGMLAALIYAWPAFTTDRDDAGKRVTAARVVTEDDGAWNCATMANHGCGPGVVPDAPEWCYSILFRQTPYAPEGSTLWFSRHGGHCTDSIDK